MMTPKRLYKYMASRFVDDFVRRGIILFRNLAYFRQCETDVNRGDLYEGRHIDRPGSGVKLTDVATGHTVEGDFAFINSVQTEFIYVFCLSTTHDPALYEAFSADACVEITSPIQFWKDCRSALRKDTTLAQWKLWHRHVEYYEEKQAVVGNIKDPETIPFFKPAAKYRQQCEYRLALASSAALVLEQRIVQGHALPDMEAPIGESPRELRLRLRGRRDYMKVHALPDIVQHVHAEDVTSR